VDGAQGASVAKWSPYDGMEVTGGVRRTWQRGRLVHEDGEILASPGDGRYVPGI
jgi:dihydroorotase-like cyclic amidohydrolase